jgi:hypothetical protein
MQEEIKCKSLLSQADFNVLSLDEHFALNAI